MDQAEADRWHRLNLLNAAAVLMDLCGLSVREALIVRAKLDDSQLARLRAAGSYPIAAASKLLAQAVLDEAQAAKPAAKPRRKKRGTAHHKCKSVKSG